jgi:hypothetical protein
MGGTCNAQGGKEKWAGHATHKGERRNGRNMQRTRGKGEMLFKILIVKYEGKTPLS